VEHTLSPQPADEERLDPADFNDLHRYIAAQAELWFGEACTSEQVHDFAWRCELGQRLKCHFAFQNLLRDLDRLGPKSVLVDDCWRC
jgi:DEAD/DEAH box helicase domain-containing protein